MKWLISDTHFNHEKSLTWLFPDRDDFQRPFASVKEMNERMFDNWNELVKPKDTIYHLGDVYWKGCPPELKKLPGKKVLIPGNHDDLKDPDLFDVFSQVMVSKVINPTDRTVVKKMTVLTHYPIHVELDWRGELNIHGHLHGNVREVSKNHWNVSVEWTGFAPVLLEED